MNDTKVTGPLRPIYGPSDPRWHELKEWLEANPDPRTGTIDDFMPSERLQWYESRVLRVEEYEAAWRAVTEIEHPDFPVDAPKPEWAERLIDEGVESVTEFPAARWIRDIEIGGSHPATIEQEVAFNPETNEITNTTPVFLDVWIAGGEGVKFTTPEDARRAAQAILDAADEFERLVSQPSKHTD